MTFAARAVQTMTLGSSVRVPHSSPESDTTMSLPNVTDTDQRTNLPPLRPGGLFAALGPAPRQTQNHLYTHRDTHIDTLPSHSFQENSCEVPGLWMPLPEEPLNKLALLTPMLKNLPFSSEMPGLRMPITSWFLTCVHVVASGACLEHAVCFI